MSEKSGLPVEEARYKGIVIFADSDSLIWAAIALLQNPKLRRGMEIRAVEFMAADQAGTGKRCSYLVSFIFSVNIDTLFEAYSTYNVRI